MVENWEPARLSSDGTKAYVPRSASSGTAIIERDLTTATERVMLRLSGESTWTVTTDGRALVATTVDLKTNEGVLVLCSLADGSVRTLFRGARSRQLGVSAWAPDKASVIVRSPSPDQEGPDTFWWVPLDGRQPKPLKELTGLIGQIEVHPGGRRLAFEIRHRIRAGEQLWMIENVLSAVGGRGR
jgi:hypothetical protein